MKKLNLRLVESFLNHLRLFPGINREIAKLTAAEYQDLVEGLTEIADKEIDQG